MQTSVSVAWAFLSSDGLLRYTSATTIKQQKTRRKMHQAVTLSSEGLCSRNLLALITGLAIFNYRWWWLYPGKVCLPVCEVLSQPTVPGRRQDVHLCVPFVPSDLVWRPHNIQSSLLWTSAFYNFKYTRHKIRISFFIMLRKFWV